MLILPLDASKGLFLFWHNENKLDNQRKRWLNPKCNSTSKVQNLLSLFLKQLENMTIILYNSDDSQEENTTVSRRIWGSRLMYHACSPSNEKL